MFKREEVRKILAQAERIDSKYEMFGASKHQYKLNPPVDTEFVHMVEEKYHFKLPEDYFQFITQVGDGGAGPDYGIMPFGNFLMMGKSPGVEKFKEAYRLSLANSFTPRPLMSHEVEYYAIATREAYEQNPGEYFVYEKADDNDLCDTDGFLELGTHGCQWDFGLIISGKMRGQIFDTDNEGAYGFVAYSFDEFYQNWLDRISDIEGFRKEVEKWRSVLQRKK